MCATFNWREYRQVVFLLSDYPTNQELTFSKSPDVFVSGPQTSFYEIDAIFSHAFKEPQWRDGLPHSGGLVPGWRVALILLESI